MQPAAPMLRTQVLCLTLALGLYSAFAMAGAPAGQANATLEARAWLARIQAAASQGNYQGTMVFSAAGTMSSWRVGHYVVGDQTFEQLEALDGQEQRVVRHNDAVQTLWPQMRMAVIEKRETLAAWSSTPQKVEPQALAQYDMRREPDARVAGRDAAVFVLEPRDALRYTQRLWADLATGLMLRADVIGPVVAGGQRPVLESTAFSEVLIGVKPQPEQVSQALQNPRKLDGYRVLRPQQQRTALGAEGWVLVNAVPGFELAGCVRRGMQVSGDEEPVLQVVFSDGLIHVSLFVEGATALRRHSEVQAHHGATATLTQKRGEHWFTAVGDVPLATLKLFVVALERRRP